MTNVSKKKLNKKLQEKLFFQFVSIFTAVEQRYISSLFEAIFTDSEKIMFVKRTAIILMLDKDRSTYNISKTLHVSDSTVRDIKIKYIAGIYDSVILAINKKTFDKVLFWETVETLLRLGMPEYGKGRWKKLR